MPKRGPGSMGSGSSFFRRTTGLSFALSMAILGFLLSFSLTWKYGLGMRQETIAYTTCAQNLLQGQGFSCFFDISGEVYVLWPPFLPLVLAFLTVVTSAHTLGILRILNAASFGLAVLLLTLLVRKHVKSKEVALFGSFLILSSKPLLFVSVSGWSESFFIFLVLLAFYSFEKYIQLDKRADLFLAAILVSLAAFTRYAGVSAILAGIILILSLRTSWKRRWLDAGIFGAIASLPLAAWLVRNELVTKTLTGPREPSRISLLDNLYGLLNCASSWFIPFPFRPPLRIAIFLLVVSAVAYGFLRQKKRTSAGPQASLGRGDWAWIAVSLCYFGFIWITRSLLELEPLTDRYLAPLAAPLVVVVLVLIDRGFGHLLALREKPALRMTVFLLAAFYLLSAFYSQVQAATGILATDGKRIMAPPKNSPLLAQLAQMSSPKHTFYSNTPDILTVLTGIPMKWSPQRGFPMNIDLRKKNPEGDAFLVWRPRRTINKFMFPDEIRKRFKLELIFTSPDGDIYRLSRYQRAG